MICAICGGPAENPIDYGNGLKSTGVGLRVQVLPDMGEDFAWCWPCFLKAYKVLGDLTRQALISENA